jgi:translation initiation factor IF-3
VEALPPAPACPAVGFRSGARDDGCRIHGMALACACRGGPFSSDPLPVRRPIQNSPNKEDGISVEPRINDRIRVREVRLVGPNGEQVGIVSTEDALRLAQEADLDLVEVAPSAQPPVAKLMDYGKFKYESAMKAREARRNQSHVLIKEQKLRPKIDTHDYETKKRNVERFLADGDKVKVTIMFRGREQSRPELGFRLLQRLASDVTDLGFVESSPKQDGRNMIMVLGPHRKKADAKVEREAERVRRAAQREADDKAEREERAASRAAAAAQKAATEKSADVG